jgi:predicted enzyme related to lactoylglutathione lyase
MDRAVAFYRDVLGLKPMVQSPGWSQFDLGNGLSIGLHIARGEFQAPAGGWVPGFVVDDVKAARQRVEAGGGRVTEDYHDIPGGVVLEFADPDGNHIDITQMGVTCADLGVVGNSDH